MRYMRFPNGKAKALTLSYDDAVEQDLRLVEIFNKNNLKCTFNINSGIFADEGTVYPEGTIHKRMSFSQVMNAYDGHEIAVHSYKHPYLDHVPQDVATYQIIEDRKNIERMFNRQVQGMAYPMGTFDDKVVETLRCCGILYSRTTISNKNFDIPKDWLRWNPTCHHENPELFELAKKFTDEEPLRFSWLFYVWGHSYEFDMNNNWNRIEEFCEKVSGKDDVWYATNMEIHNYVEAYNSLMMSVEETIIFNPTLIDVWFWQDGELYCIKSGETLYMK